MKSTNYFSGSIRIRGGVYNGVKGGFNNRVSLTVSKE